MRRFKHLELFITILIWGSLFLSVPGARAENQIALIPNEIQLNRSGQKHQIMVEHKQESLWKGDLTDKASFLSSNTDIATVDETGKVRAVGNGEATITAVVGDQSATAVVKVSGADEPFNWSFRNHIQPILYKKGCSTGACHGAAAGKNGFKLSLRGYDFEADHMAITREADGRRVSLAKPEDSLLLLKPTAQVPHEGGERFTKDSESYQMLLEWIQDGAPAASDDDPVITRLEILPKQAMLSVDTKQRMIVRAHFTDGTYRDITEWAKFDTTDESVAVVDDVGVVSVLAPGSTCITVWYSSKVISADILVPRSKPIPEEVYAKADRHNYIDDLVSAKLKSLQIAPTVEADDEVFIRRVYLDTLGILPEPKEVKGFLQSGNPNKRSALIDRILDRPEFVDYWSYKWSDLLLVSSKKLTEARELNAFYRFIRESVQENKPWDEFVGQIVTASGNTVENGAAAFFKMHKETTDLTETTSQAFLGMSITCARCHNHPLEKWTQDDYYGMANLLSRVKLKNGKDGGTEVIANPFGNILHPKKARALPPKPLDGESIPVDSQIDRREVLAEWLTSPENPYFTRAIVNRVWSNFMGRGLVDPVDDLRLTNPSSNAPLMEALANHLAENHYDLKDLMRTIMNSATYQRSSAPSDPEQPDNKYYSQYIMRRLPAEVILDAYSQVTQVPTDFPGYPKGARALELRDSEVASYFLTA
ncbi:MAG: DUF1549 domain-containing protein, partial [Candidatus Omnitrophica bacterium]|nr:DUF1549 domain-containing protein [Candidatus Omnitrophota bacterium]